jgi:nitroimidazol reductase NimA-like FMN-containing flavoprotein (pyridoxamine 5'-phosphate oxidase superfamily)
MKSAVAPSQRARVRRHPERGAYDRETIDRILDEALICHIGFIADGLPWVMPTMYARQGDLLYVHGSPVSRMLRATGTGADVCITVTLLDGLVLARSVFNHSMNYRSVVVIGKSEEVTDTAQKMVALRPWWTT